MPPLGFSAGHTLVKLENLHFWNSMLFYLLVSSSFSVFFLSVQKVLSLQISVQVEVLRCLVAVHCWRAVVCTQNAGLASTAGGNTVVSIELEHSGCFS